MEERDPWTAFRLDPTEERFLPLYEGTKRLVWTLCLRILRDREEAGEAFQSTYCLLLLLLKDPHPAAWEGEGREVLSRIAIREADRLRKRRGRRRKREGPLEEAMAMDDRQEPVDEAVAREETRERVEAFVDRLPDGLRLPVELHFFHGLSQREVARALGQPLSTVSDRIRGALRRLDPAFRKAGLGPAAATLAGLGLGGALLDPSLAAGVVFARAQAAVAAMTPAAIGTVATGAASILSPTLMGVIALMKTKVALVAAVILFALGGFLIQRQVRERDPEPSPFSGGGRSVARRSPEDERPPVPAGNVAPAGTALSSPELEVRVIFGESGEPVAGAEVVLLEKRGAAGPSVKARTGEDGRSILRLPGGLRSAWIEARHAEGAGEGVEVALPARGAVTLTLDEDVITGLVADASSGEPLPRAVVRQVFPRKVEAVADASGVYRLGGLGKGVHELTASAEGHADHWAQVNHPAGRSIQDFRLDAAGTITITVSDEEGAPVPRAAISSSRPGAEGIYRDTGLKTDESGQALVERVSRLHSSMLQVAKEGYRTEYLKPEIDPRGEFRDLEAVLKRVREEERAIAGRITDRGGRPIPGVTVEWKDGAGTRFGEGVEYGQWKAVSDRSGAYRLGYSDAHATCSLGVAKKGWAPVVVGGVKAGTPERPAEMDFTLEPAHWLAGRVLDDAERPIPGVRIRAMPRKGLLNEGVAYPAVLRQGETDAEGRFRLDDLSGPTAALLLRGGDRPQAEMEVQVDQEVDLVLKGWGAIRGRVVDGLSGEPVTLFNLKSWGEGGNIETGETFTSPEGRFLLGRLNRGRKFGLLVQAEGYRLADLEDLTAGGGGDDEELTIALERGAPVEGMVVDSSTGSPLVGVEIGFTSFEGVRDLLAMEWGPFWGLKDFQRIVTGPDGAFRFQEGKPAALLVRAAGRRKLLVPPAERAALRGPGGRLRIPLEAGESLNGFYHEDGRPAAGVPIRIAALKEGASPGEDLEGESHGEVKSGPEGAFGWHDLSPGRYLLSVERSAGEGKPDLKVEVRRRIEVKPGEEAVCDLGKELGKIVLRGRLLGMESRVSVWAKITLKPASGGEEELFQKTYRDWEWRFSFPFLRPGKHAVEIEVYTPEGNRKVLLPPVEISSDQVQVEDLEVPAEG